VHPKKLTVKHTGLVSFGQSLDLFMSQTGHSQFTSLFPAVPVEDCLFIIYIDQCAQILIRCAHNVMIGTDAMGNLESLGSTGALCSHLELYKFNESLVIQ